MFRIAICDDSNAFLQQTKFMIEHWDNRPIDAAIELFEDGDSLLTAHGKRPFDIILLDIIMPLLNGIDTAKELREKDKNVKIVFLTSSAEFAVESYTVKASNYLLKPVIPQKLFACLSELISDYESAGKYITVKEHNASHRVHLADIEFIESQGKRILFSMTGNRTLQSLEPLYTYENMLHIDDGFIKCHRSYIVNAYHIDSYTHSEIIMQSGCRIPISRSSQKEFETLYFRVIFGKAGESV